jgi:hypothetical protein
LRGATLTRYTSARPEHLRHWPVLTRPRLAAFAVFPEAWAMRSRLEPMKRAARTIRDRLWGIVNAIVLGVTNAGSESQNAKIQWIKKQACGFRNRERFRNAMYFHLGGLDLYPRAASATHTTS